MRTPQVLVLSQGERLASQLHGHYGTARHIHDQHAVAPVASPQPEHDPPVSGFGVRACFRHTHATI